MAPEELKMKVLIAYDGSEGAKRALLFVAELFHPGEVAVRLVGVPEGVPMVGYAGTLPSPEEEEERQRELEEAAKVLADRGFSPTIARRNGDPATVILDEAESQGADLIALGTRGLSTVERWLVGSVSSKVLHHAHCSVLVVR
jgi:nucleotide-binding universal stress UspA family protein